MIKLSYNQMAISSVRFAFALAPSNSKTKKYILVHINCFNELNRVIVHDSMRMPGYVMLHESLLSLLLLMTVIMLVWFGLFSDNNIIVNNVFILFHPKLFFVELYQIEFNIDIIEIIIIVNIFYFCIIYLLYINILLCLVNWH